MSKHGGKRLSVFERLGPGTESESQHVPTPPPPPPRHRHYPVERHSERGVHSLSTEDRHKSISDQDVVGLKHHDGDTTSGRNRSSHLTKTPKERSKADHVYLSHSSERIRGRQPGRGESTSSSNSGSMSDGEKDDGRRKRTRESLSSSRRGKESGGDRRAEHSRADEQLVVDPVKGEEERRRRKRERLSIGDSDSGRMVKRAHLDIDVDHSHHRSSDTDRRHTRERRDVQDRKKQRPVDSQSDTEPLTDSLLDWSAIARLPLPHPSRKSVSHLDKYAGGALLASVGCSAQLAGEELAAQVQQAVSSYIQVTQEGLLPESVLKQPFGDEELTSAAASYLQNQVTQAGLLYELRPCRRALTAQADCLMRKQLKSAGSKMNCYTHPPLVSWDRELYASSVALYQSLGQKSTSSKPSHRLSTSRVGALLSPR